jgi:hypothetical protein
VLGSVFQHLEHAPRSTGMYDWRRRSLRMAPPIFASLHPESSGVLINALSPAFRGCNTKATARKAITTSADAGGRLCSMRVAGVLVLVERLLMSGSSSLVWLDLALNDVNDGGARALLRVIEDDSSPLEYLDLKVIPRLARRHPWYHRFSIFFETRRLALPSAPTPALV